MAQPPFYALYVLIHFSASLCALDLARDHAP